MRARTARLLIFDEVMTGFRVARGGAQELFGIQTRSDRARQSHRRRFAGRRVRRPRRNHGSAFADGSGLPGWNAVGKSAGDGRRTRAVARTGTHRWLATARSNSARSLKYADSRDAARSQTCPDLSSHRFDVLFVLHRSARCSIWPPRRHSDPRNVRALFHGIVSTAAFTSRLRNSRPVSSRPPIKPATSKRRPRSCATALVETSA